MLGRSAGWLVGKGENIGVATECSVISDRVSESAKGPDLYTECRADFVSRETECLGRLSARPIIYLT